MFFSFYVILIVLLSKFNSDMLYSKFILSEVVVLDKYVTIVGVLNCTALHLLVFTHCLHREEDLNG